MSRGAGSGSGGFSVRAIGAEPGVLRVRGARIGTLGRWSSLGVCGAALVVLFGADLFLPLGVSGGLPYLAAVLLAFLSRIRRLPLYIAAAATLFVALGGFFSPPGVEVWIAAVNRTLSVIALWVTAVGGLRLADTMRGRLRKSSERARSLRRADRLKNEIVGNLSHELRTPLNAVLGYTTLLREGVYGNLSPEQDGVLARIVAASQRLLRLIDDLLVASRIRGGEMRLVAAEVSLPELAEQVGGAVQPLVRKKGLSWRNEVDPDFPTLRTDGDKLRRVLLGLVSNAVKFTPEGSVSVRAETLESRGLVRIEVEDTGIGIAPEDQEAIFEHFRQVDSSRTREHGGMGLGLFIVRRLVLALGGTVRVESVEGLGSSFRVEIPRRIEGTSEEDAATGARAESAPAS